MGEEKLDSEEGKDFQAPTTGEPGAESRVENPVVARIAAEREDEFREIAQEFASGYRRIMREGLHMGGTERKPNPEVAQRFEALASRVGTFWRNVSEKALEKGWPLPLTVDEDVRRLALHNDKLYYRERFSEIRGGKDAAEYKELLARHAVYDGWHPLILEADKELAEEYKKIHKDFSDLRRGGFDDITRRWA